MTILYKITIQFLFGQVTEGCCKTASAFARAWGFVASYFRVFSGCNKSLFMNMNIAVLHLSLESNSHLLCFRLVFIEDDWHY